MLAYAELHCWSNFTFLQGASHPEELANRAAALNLHALALTDRDGLYGSVRFNKAAKSAGLGALCGSELTMEDGSRLVLLVQNPTGYAHLVELISGAQMRGAKRDARLRIDDLARRTDGLFALSGGAGGVIERAIIAGKPERAAQSAAIMRDFFPGRFYIELQHHLRSEDACLVERMVQLAQRLNIPYVATNGVVYAVREDARLADVLTCIKHKTTLQKSGTLLRPNAEFYLKSPSMMTRIFSPYPQAVRNTVEIAERCTFRLDTLSGQFPTFPLPESEASAQTYLRTLVYRGAKRLYGGIPLDSKVERQLEYELGIIARLDLAGYFLIVWDIVRAAAEMDVLCQGRGSAANSAVCYALGITAVDPIGGRLLFERFLSEERREVPDIDIDFAHQDRERVIQYVYNRYGRKHAAMAAEVITYRTRSAIRDVGKAFGLSVAQVNQVVREFDACESLAGATGVREVTKSAPQAKQRKQDEYLCGSRTKNVSEDPNHHIPTSLTGTMAQRVFAFCRRIDGFPRHMGIHSGGMVITRDPLIRVAPVEWATMRDRTVVQWDKDDLGDLGLIKIDLLGLGMLSLLREAFSIHKRVNQNALRHAQGDKRELSLYTIPPGDEATYAMLQKADSIGVFQIESRAQQSMLPRMKPHCFYDLVMQVAIIRPGPIQGDMIHPFLRRRNGFEAVTYPHPKLKPILERTLGVPLFQEQGMRMAIEAAGFSPGQADQLRRAMGHKRSHDRMAQIYPKLMDGMVQNGIDRDSADKLFHMLEGFADYGFPESHAASFALLAYASAYVKCHYPAVFTAAILNVQPMGFYSTEVLVNDARHHGVIIKPITVNDSEFWSSVDKEGALRLGFHLVRGLGDAQQKQLQKALMEGKFDNIVDFAKRTQLGKEALENLAISGAFGPWFSTRRQAMWALRGLDEREMRGELGRMMDVEEPEVEFAPLTQRQETGFDFWSLGLSPQRQPISHFRKLLDRKQVIVAERLVKMPKNLVCKVAGMVITRQRPGTAKGFVFLTLEDETGLVNIIVRPDVYERNRRLIRQSMALIIEGVLQKDQGCTDVIAKRFWPLDTKNLLRGVRSRNFH